MSQANKLKREERLNEIDDLLQNNKELQEQIMQKLDEARALNATTEVLMHWTASIWFCQLRAQRRKGISDDFAWNFKSPKICSSLGYGLVIISEI